MLWKKRRDCAGDSPCKLFSKQLLVYHNSFFVFLKRVSLRGLHVEKLKSKVYLFTTIRFGDRYKQREFSQRFDLT